MSKEKHEHFSERHPKMEMYLYKFVAFTMYASVVILTILIILAPSSVSAEVAEKYSDIHEKSYYVLMLTESILGCVVITIPRILETKFHVRIPSRMLVAFVVFLYCAIFLGEVRFFYYRFNFWDTVLHFFSACQLATLAYSIVSILNQSERVPVNMSAGFVALFAFCFAVSGGALWEIYEFTGDSLLDMNMQKWRTEEGEPLIGHAALEDTMKDIIVDVLGAGVISLSGYFSMKKEDNWLQNQQLVVDEAALAEDKKKRAEGKAAPSSSENPAPSQLP